MERFSSISYFKRYSKEITYGVLIIESHPISEAQLNFL